MGIKKKTKLKSLSRGRPPTTKKPIQSISSKATRTIIRTHHTLEKRRAKALAEGDTVTAAALAREIATQGGLETYQRASLIGQRNDRGGDSSKILMEWLSPLSARLKDQASRGTPLRMLEVGALSINNASSRSHAFLVERIDLNSQSEGITQQDFMERPLPKDDSEKFDIISLSLVLNYVPDGVGRGDMLLRTLKFLHAAPPTLNELEAIMESLGYVMVKKKLSNKLVYYLWRLSSRILGPVSWKKEEIRAGKSRNNFSVVLKK
ncbi:25S rRNA (adenine2142-N1)-methyltransferase [Clarireedia jacksonii]